jgi:hypothetical protein
MVQCRKDLWLAIVAMIITMLFCQIRLAVREFFNL